TKIVFADNSKISHEFIQKFDYTIFKENAAIALAVAEALNISRETALRGMLNANPDPGALRVTPFTDLSKKTSFFINGFAANDTTSTLAIWDHLQSTSFIKEDKGVVINCREDRIDRTKDFCEKVLPELGGTKLIVIGQNVHPILKAYESGELPYDKLINLEGKSADIVLDRVRAESHGTTLFGIGNIHGAGEAFLETLQHSPQVKHCSVGEEAI
ncbi:poly-gamma-glutamate synthase PgsB, partial [Alteribacillus sp. HJP-4]